MKVLKKVVFSFMGMVFIAVLFLASRNHRIPFTVGNTKYILVKDANFNRSSIRQANAALLIRDKKEIAENERLFLDNGTYGHACGYHYTVQFWAAPHSQVVEIPFNQECEEFLRSDSKIQSKMKDYIKQLENQPTHYIYNLKIPVAIEPKNLLKSFDNSGLDLFFMNGTSSHYATLSFSFLQVRPIKEMVDRSKWQGEKEDNAKAAIGKMKEIIEDIKAVETIIEQSDISFPMQSFGGGTIDHQAAVNLKFKNGIDLKRVKEIIELNGGKIESEYNPEYYYIQLLYPSDSLVSVQKVLKNYKIIKGVYEYPQTN